MMARKVTDAQRIAYTIARLKRWAENFDANADRAQARGDMGHALDLRKRANDARDVIEMLDGTEDDHIRAVGTC
jgi:hypothetical protein